VLAFIRRTDPAPRLARCPHLGARAAARAAACGDVGGTPITFPEFAVVLSSCWTSTVQYPSTARTTC